MIILGHVKSWRWKDFRNNRPIKHPCLLEPTLRLTRECHLFLIVRKNDRPILRTAINKLSTSVGRIHLFPKGLEQGLIIHDPRIISDFHDLNVTSMSCCHFGVSWMTCRATSVTRHHCTDAMNGFKGGFQAPKASATEGGFMGIGH